MSSTAGYKKNASADNQRYFHGREVRSVENAAGGMNFVLHLSDTEDDVEGWSQQEIDDYDGWGHDGGRHWRKLAQWQSEGVQFPVDKFGERAYGLHHRFYLHLDAQNHFWLAAEDGCEGKASEA